MLKFNELGLSPDLLKAIDDLGFEKPSPIQEEIIPIITNKTEDAIGLAQTGTGKTAAFALPLIDKVDTNSNIPQILILSPTRELCMQIENDIKVYSKYSKGIKTVAIYGGANMQTQIKAVKKGAQIIVATPGRMLDMVYRKKVDLKNIFTLVLDEADEMLNMGFKEELDAILKTTPKNKRTLLFSATMSKEVSRIAKAYLKEPLKVTIGKQNAGTENVKHVYYKIHAKDRYIALKRLADFNPNIYGLVFCRTRKETQEVADKLIKDGYSADALHGDLSQNQRDHVMNRFRNKSLQMLVATDVAARGLDVDDITHVINYRLPDENEIYNHRTGRTGRADKSGIAISLVNFQEVKKIPEIEKIISRNIEKKNLPSGKEICNKQLFNLVSDVENAIVDEKQIAPFIDEVFKKLSWLSKEELIKRFISLEFNRFLEYYKDAPDLNKKALKGLDNKKSKKDSGRKSKKGKRSRKDGVEEGFSRFYISVGRKDKFSPKEIISLINDKTRDRDINIGAIDIKDSFSFFEVNQENKDKVMSSFDNVKIKGRKIRLEIAEKDEKSKKKKSRKRKK